MDATLFLYGAKWVIAEIVRLLHDLTTEEAALLVDALVQREVAGAEEVPGGRAEAESLPSGAASGADDHELRVVVI